MLAGASILLMIIELGFPLNLDLGLLDLADNLGGAECVRTRFSRNKASSG
jgi:hypothetical protein